MYLNKLIFNDVSINSNLNSSEIILIVMLVLIILTLIFFIMFHWLQFKKIFRWRRDKNRNPKKVTYSIFEVADAMWMLKRLKKGALVIFERNNSTINEIIDGKLLNAEISSELIVTIFEGTKTPLHDGAIIIRENKITFAGGFITSLARIKDTNDYVSTEKNKFKKKSLLGTRHRSAISVTSKLDCIAVTLSEETNKVSLIYEGKVNNINSKNELVSELSNILVGTSKYK